VLVGGTPERAEHARNRHYSGQDHDALNATKGVQRGLCIRDRVAGGAREVSSDDWSLRSETRTSDGLAFLLRPKRVRPRRPLA